MSVAGAASFDSTSALTFPSIDTTATVGTTYPQLSATGNVALGGAELSLATACGASLTAGDTLALIKTTGSGTSITGELSQPSGPGASTSPIPNGAVVAGGTECASSSPPTAFTFFQIHYTQAAVTATVTNLQPTATFASVSPASTTAGSTVTYSANVAPAGPSSTGTPTGTVTFTTGSGSSLTTLCTTSALSSGTASCTAATAPVGTDTVTATYSGGSTFGPSAGTITLTVTRRPPPPPTIPPPAPSTSKDVATGFSTVPTGSTGTVESKNPTTGVVAKANATGEGAVTVAQLSSAPKPPPSTLTVGSLVDVRVSSGSSFSKLTEKVCGAKVGTAITWYDTSTGAWETLKPTSGPTLSTGTPPCVSFSLSSSSSPAISQLTGTAFAVGTSVVPPVVRVTGETADATAAAELTRAFPYASGSCPASRAAVLATTSVYQDALSSQLLAESLTTGTLLTPTESLSSVTAATLKDEGITTVYVVGGPLAVTTTVVKAIEAMTAYKCGETSPSGKITVTRIYGQTASGTAEAVAAHVGTAASKSFSGAYGTTNAAGGTGKYNDTAGKGSRWLVSFASISIRDPCPDLKELQRCSSPDRRR